MKQIEVKPNGTAKFSLDMTLQDPNSSINLYKVSYQYLKINNLNKMIAKNKKKQYKREM